MWADELDRKPDEEDAPAKAPEIPWSMLVIILVCGLGGVAYHLVWLRNLGTTALMFVGLPLALAVALAFTPGAKSAKGAIVKGLTFALLVAAPLVGEGYVCILMASPLFYFLGLVVGAVIDASRKTQKGPLASVALLAFIPMAFEGVTPKLTFGRQAEVEAVKVVAGTSAETRDAVSQGLRVGTPLPAFLNIGFPRPLAVEGTGLQVGDLRRIHFSGAEGDGPGDLVMRVAASAPDYVRFERVSDESHLRQWMAWEVSEVRWRAKDAAHTEVRWKIQYRRRLDPAWYFGPWERFAVKEAAEYLIAADAEPQRGPR